jgi:RHS repeat-associated protein
VWLYRGYTGHEQLDAFGLINMNGRLYDPALARVLSPDNYVQDPFSSQHYNRYSYAHNNPLVYNDPDGQLPHLVIGALVGGFANLAIKAFQGDIRSFQDGLVAFGIGALAGVVSAGVGQAITASINVGGFIGGAMVGAAAGGSGGFVSGAANAWMGGASFWGGLGSGLRTGVMGAIGGGIIGGTVAGIDAVRGNASFWNGKVNEVGGYAGSNGTYLDEEIPAGSKPTATGEIAKTSSNPNYGKYGLTRNGGTKPHYGVDYAGKEGDKIFGMYDGTVTRIGGSKAYGANFVRTSSVLNGKTYNVDYGHMSKHVLTLKQVIKAGDLIGYMGRLGNLANSTFPTHVHIAVWRPVNGLQGFVMPSWR